MTDPVGVRGLPTQEREQSGPHAPSRCRSRRRQRRERRHRPYDASTATHMVVASCRSASAGSGSGSVSSRCPVWPKPTRTPPGRPASRESRRRRLSQQALDCVAAHGARADVGERSRRHAIGDGDDQQLGLVLPGQAHLVLPGHSSIPVGVTANTRAPHHERASGPAVNGAVRTVGGNAKTRPQDSARLRLGPSASHGESAHGLIRRNGATAGARRSPAPSIDRVQGHEPLGADTGSSAFPLARLVPVLTMVWANVSMKLRRASAVDAGWRSRVTKAQSALLAISRMIRHRHLEPRTPRY